MVEARAGLAVEDGEPIKVRYAVLVRRLRAGRARRVIACEACHAVVEKHRHQHARVVGVDGAEFGLELEDDVARSRSYMHVLNMSMGGIYTCRCRRTRAGWRIEHLTLDERSFDEVAERLRSHMQAVDEGRA